MNASELYIHTYKNTYIYNSYTRKDFKLYKTYLGKQLKSTRVQQTYPVQTFDFLHNNSLNICNKQKIIEIRLDCKLLTRVLQSDHKKITQRRFAKESTRRGVLEGLQLVCLCMYCLAKVRLMSQNKLHFSKRA